MVVIIIANFSSIKTMNVIESLYAYNTFSADGELKAKCISIYVVGHDDCLDESWHSQLTHYDWDLRIEIYGLRINNVGIFVYEYYGRQITRYI